MGLGISSDCRKDEIEKDASGVMHAVFYSANDSKHLYIMSNDMPIGYTTGCRFPSLFR